MKKVTPFGLKIAIIDRALKRYMDNWASEMGLTFVQLRVLTHISCMEEKNIYEINQCDLEKTEKVTHPTMTGIIKRLESKGFIKCCKGETDKRFKKINCTEKSKCMHKKLDNKDEEMFRKICDGFSEQEMQLFDSFLDRILENLSQNNENN